MYILEVIVCYEMLGKMILAIDLSSEEVSRVELDRDQVDQMQMVGEPKKLFFFGRNFPGSFGQLKNWYGHRVMQSHKISELLAQPDLKKETWGHLKKYASLK